MTASGAQGAARPSEPLVVTSRLPGESVYWPAGLPTVSVRCGVDSDYWHGVADAWTHDGALVLIEHDMEVSDELVRELLDCPHQLCTFAYTLYWVSTGTAAHYAQRTAAGYWLEKGQEWADFTGIGFCKIAPRVRLPELVNPDAPQDCHWSHVDTAVCKSVTGRWHVHREIAHDHV